MAGLINRVYTDEQREAIFYAVDTLKTKAREVVNRARAGELAPDLAPFEIPENSVRDIVRVERKRRAGKAVSTVAGMPAPDAVETMRRRLISAADYEMTRLERKQKTARTPQERETVITGLRSVARLIKEASAIPGPGDARPAAREKRDQPNLGEAPAQATQAPAILRSFAAAGRSNGHSGPATDHLPTHRQEDRDEAHADGATSDVQTHEQQHTSAETGIRTGSGALSA